MEKRAVMCPSGMRGIIKSLNVGEEKEFLLSTRGSKPHQLILSFVQKGWVQLVDPGPYNFKGTVDWNQILQGDLVYLLYMVRCVTFTSEYEVVMPCGSCSGPITLKTDIENDLHVKELPEEAADHVGSNIPIAFEFTRDDLSTVKMQIRLLRFSDHKLVGRIEDQESLTVDDAALAARIVHIDGVEGGPRFLIRWLKELNLADAAALRETIEHYECGIDAGVEASCSACGFTQEVVLPLAPSFFRRPPREKDVSKPKGRRLGSTAEM
jgi:hypothetical protein